MYQAQPNPSCEQAQTGKMLFVFTQGFLSSCFRKFLRAASAMQLGMITFEILQAAEGGLVETSLEREVCQILQGQKRHRMNMPGSAHTCTRSEPAS